MSVILRNSTGTKIVPVEIESREVSLMQHGQEAYDIILVKPSIEYTDEIRDYRQEFLEPV